jgi:glycerol-3-phosphate dehydrogenase subunit B
LSEVLIIGGGFSGLFAACLTAKNDLDTTIVMKGRGGLSFAHGAIELFDRASPSGAISNLKPPHPYALAGKEHLVAGLREFLTITSDAGIEYQGGRSTRKEFLTATGSTRRASYLPRASAAGELGQIGPGTALGWFEELRDFQAHYAAHQSARALGFIPQVLTLPLLQPFSGREIYALDAAHTFDDLEWTAENARAWKPHLVGVESLGLPAVLGFIDHTEVQAIIEEILSIPVFELPTLPPSVPGLRLEKALRDYAQNRGVRFIEGPTAQGRIQKRNGRVRAAGAALDAAGRQTSIDSDTVVLATGSFLHGGLVSTQRGYLREPVFNIPANANPDRRTWTGATMFSEQEYARFGIGVNEQMQPLDANQDVLLENLYAVGGLLKSADRTMEGSRQGIDIATAHCAVHHLCRSLA